METYDLAKAYGRLREDKWRVDHPFSDDLEKVNRIALNPYRSHAQRESAYLLWMRRGQPCLFGRNAAVQERIHFCFIGDEELTQSDQAITASIQKQLLAWKRRSVRPYPEFSKPAHGFVLVALSPRLALAAPDDNLYEFSNKLLSLWNEEKKADETGMVNFETLYLQNPDTGEYVKFRFSIDFFAAQGDGRWWQDHRVPGGIAFTANSVGHMRHFQEWYEKRTGQREWVIKMAMRTIESAAKTPYGQATWLRDLIQGKPVAEKLVCPFADSQKLPPGIQNKDWTRYGGHLHTDHAVRKEFFYESPEKPPEITGTEYLQSFSYLYDEADRDNPQFVKGLPVTQKEVFDAIGDPSEYPTITGYKPKVSTESLDYEAAETSPEVYAGRAEVENLLQELAVWAAGGTLT